MKFSNTPLPDLISIEPAAFPDNRGTFVKIFQEDEFARAGIAFTPREEFFSISAKDVIRGMHFQLPPAAQNKLVYCTTGRILDVILDLRRDSPTYGQTHSIELSAANRTMLYIPVGFAHGFLSLEKDSTVHYMADHFRDPAHDSGIHWNSFGFSWPVTKPTLGTRDHTLQALAAFKSPFTR